MQVSYFAEIGKSKERGWGARTNVAGAWNTLHLHLEGVDVLRKQNVLENAGGVGKLAVDSGGEVALQAAGVVSEGTVGVTNRDATRKVKASRAEVDLHILEGAASNTTTTSSGREDDRRKAVAGSNNDITLVRNSDTVAGHRVGAAVKVGGVLEAGQGGQAPVPVGLGTSVAALLAQGLLVEPGKVPMPREKVAGVVDLHGLVDVHGDEVIEARLNTRSLSSGPGGRLGLEAEHSVGVSLAL